MRIALVGPTHPFKGGVAVHTTLTAHRLAADGHDVELLSWERLYPARLYPGELAVPAGQPETPPFEPTRRTLRWDRPATWWAGGRRLRGCDLVVLVVVVPAQVPALLTLARAARSGSRSGPASRPGTVALAHNVRPHESHPGSAWLMARLVRGTDGALVHSVEQGALAAGLGARRVAVAALPAHLPGGPPPAAPAARPDRRPGEPVRVLALGFVRDYKGVDVLLEAAAEVPGVHVTVAGELWGSAGERVRALAGRAEARGRVTLRAGYVPGAEIPALLAAHDVLALPYRSATGSQNVLLGHAHGLPVLASRVGPFADQVRDGVDGILVPPGDAVALARALADLGRPGRLEALRRGVSPVAADAGWAAYVEALTGLAAVARR